MNLSLTELFENNRRWAAQTVARDPSFFQRLMEQQEPHYLWIGCADSRVPANQITGLLPGDVFVHRNVANVVVHSDLNCLSVLQFAIDQLKVKHVIVVGHYGCGGVRAALGDLRVGLVDNWLRHVQDVRHRHWPWLESLPAEQRLDALCELNVLEQVVNICQTTVVQDAWSRGQSLVVHGWVYGLHDGLLKDLEASVQNGADLQATAAAALHAHKERFTARRQGHAAKLPGGPRDGS
ncbi:MAG: carbonate dehydratase [Planctomycetes bacterium]|nr:carbonate dehydratase [Planctomycetota bacterium]